MAVLSLKIAVPLVHAGGRNDSGPAPGETLAGERGDAGRYRRLERILREGRRLLSAGEYAAAMEEYTAGLDGYRAEFFPGPGNENRILPDPAPIIEDAKRFSEMAAGLNRLTLAMDRLSREPDAPLSEVSGLYEKLLEEIEPLLSFRNILFFTGAAVSAELRRLRDAEPGQGDGSFLVFAEQLISGPPGRKGEGMIGAAEGLENRVIADFEEAVAVISRRYGLDSPAVPERDTGSGWNAGLSRLGAEIERLQYGVFLREFRILISDVREAYFAGHFERAEELLVQARGRSRFINNQEDAELSYWLTLVRGGRSLRGAKIIPVTAPLYAEMSQLLSDAKRSYEEGIRFINSDRRNLGLAKLTEARQKTREIKLLFPVNQEADFLALRIDRIADPAAFDRSFRLRLSEAVAGTKLRSLEAFIDLQNLAAIDPWYPDIGNILEQAEKDMGYRHLPPNPHDLAQSDELTLEAQTMVYGHNQDQYPLALEKINRALQLNPYNNQAAALKDRLQIDIGEMGLAALDRGAEQDYQRAVLALQQGNPITALSILRQLLLDPRYRNTEKITALRRRIESVL